MEQTKKQARLLNLPLEISYLESGKSNYNIKPKSMIITLALTNDLTNIYITPEFLANIPANCYITLTTANTIITDIFGNIPAFVVYPTNITPTEKKNEIK